MLTILATIVVLGVLIFVHELGHFMTAKMVDIEVPRFSIGFGPRILGFTRGETEYVISLLPLGGYVKMAGMEEMEQIEGGPVTVNDTVSADDPQEVADRPRRPRDFESKSLPARALVISAGVIMNLLFAFVVFSISRAVWGVAADPGPSIGNVSEERLVPGAEPLAMIDPGSAVRAVNDEPVTTWREMTLELTRARAGATTLHMADGGSVQFELPAADEERGSVISALEPSIPAPAVLAEVLGGGPAAEAGLQAGDSVIQAGGTPIGSWQQLVAVIERSGGQPLPLVVVRDGQRMEVELTPEPRALENGMTVGRMDVQVPYTSFDQYLPREKPGVIAAVGQGAQQTWDVTVLTVDFLVGMITGRHSARNVGGPIMIGQMSGRMARAGLEAFLGFMAILSVNLAVLNLLPIPVLDGGHLVFLGAEAVRGRPLSLNQRMRMTQVGFVMVLMLMAWAIGNDLLRAIGL